MPKARTAVNAFPPKLASEIVELSVHTLNYLARQGYLVPSYYRSGKRGKTRYYSYRDLVIARIVQKLLAAGLELTRLKDGIKKLPQYANWAFPDEPEKALRLLGTDGHDLFVLEKDGTLLDLTHDGQLAFAFVLNVSTAQDEIRAKLTPEQLANFNLKNLRVRYA